VDNEAKACLDEIALSAQQNSEAKLAIVGNAGGDEKGGKKLAASAQPTPRLIWSRKKASIRQG
jgi:hypothetical protein